jgi:hypothetical protein
MARMIEGCQDPMVMFRRAIAMAVEDIGLADPEALKLAVAARDAYRVLGPPEGYLPLAEMTIYLATAPKSNAGYRALQAALEAAQETPPLVPLHIGTHRPGPRRSWHHAGCRYAHDYEGAYVRRISLTATWQALFEPGNGFRERDRPAAGAAQGRPSWPLARRHDHAAGAWRIAVGGARMAAWCDRATASARMHARRSAPLSSGVVDDQDRHGHAPAYAAPPSWGVWTHPVTAALVRTSASDASPKAFIVRLRLITSSDRSRSGRHGRCRGCGGCLSDLLRRRLLPWRLTPGRLTFGKERSQSLRRSALKQTALTAQVASLDLQAIRIWFRLRGLVELAHLRFEKGPPAACAPSVTTRQDPFPGTRPGCIVIVARIAWAANGLNGWARARSAVSRCTHFRALALMMPRCSATAAA